MWKFLRGSAPASGVSRSKCRPAPGPIASLARDYAAFDATFWAVARRRAQTAEIEAK